ncbi:MAG TPA: hypothetical protein VGQ83_00985 [Polyangia bacterium]
MKPCRAALSLAASLGLALGCSSSAAPGQQDAAAHADRPSFGDTTVKPDAAACENQCQQGDRRCSPGGYQECGNTDTDPCLEWGPVTPCPGTQKCVGGTCQSGCTSECSDGSVQCTADGLGRQSCALDESGCYVWGAAVACPGAQTCSAGQCRSACVDECADGSRQCSGAGYQVCGPAAGSTCLAWGAVVPCTGTQTCSDGQCADACVSECAAATSRCASADGFQVCGDFDPDACLEWGPVTPCPSGKLCSNGKCEDACRDECAAVGDQQCTPAGTSYQVCAKGASDACRRWGSPVDCGTNQVCTNGQCVAKCACDYYRNVCEAASPGSSTACACDPDCAGKQPCQNDGHCDTWCPLGTDPDCGATCACNYNQYCEAGAQGSSDSCACDPDCETHDVACMDDGHCDSWCPPGVDPDCGGAAACRERVGQPGMSVGWRFGSELYLDGSYSSPDPVKGAEWALLSPGLAAGYGEMWVEMAAEHVACVDALVMEVYGYDDSYFGTGAQMYLYNWDTLRFDLLPTATVGATLDFYQNRVGTAQPYLLCGTGAKAKCYVNAKLAAGAFDNTHVWWVEVWAHTHP